MTNRTKPSSDEAQLRAVVDDYANALRAKDADRVLAYHAADLVQFVLAPPLQYAGANALGKKELRAWFSTFDGSIGLEVRDLRITAGDTVAFCHSLNRMSGSKSDGESVDMWVRETLCLRKIGGEWKITHQHESVPFYMDGSVRAAVDLEP